MRRRHTSVQEEATIDMTPMLDIVFIMLIFFIVTTSFVKETGIDVNRPTADSAEQKKEGSILIAIKSNGEIWMDRRLIDPRAVRANVERMLAEMAEAGVVIIADRAATTGVLVEVMDQAKLAGAKTISVAAEKNQS